MSDERPTNVRVEYAIEATIKMQDFQFVKPAYRISADVPPGVHPNTVREKLQALADGWIENEIDEYRESKLSQLGG